MQIVAMTVPAQDGITKDNVTVRVDAVVYFRVVDPIKATINVQNYLFAISQQAQTSLRSIIGQSEMDQLLSERDAVNRELRRIIDEPTEGPWGIRVERVEIKDVSLPESMKRSMSRQAEAERERRARIITADGEYQASKRLAAAANVMARDPAALQLRLLQTVVEVAAEKNSTLVMPVPVELLRFFDKMTPPAPAGEPNRPPRTRRRWPTSATRTSPPKRRKSRAERRRRYPRSRRSPPCPSRWATATWPPPRYHSRAQRPGTTTTTPTPAHRLHPAIWGAAAAAIIACLPTVSSSPVLLLAIAGQLDVRDRPPLTVTRPIVKPPPASGSGTPPSLSPFVPRGLCGLAVAAWTVGKTPRWGRSPVMRSPWSTCGETAARRRNPPRSLARRPVPISTARPGRRSGSPWTARRRARWSRGGAGREAAHAAPGAQAMSSPPLSSATVMPPVAGVERVDAGAVVVGGSMMGLLSGCGGTR